MCCAALAVAIVYAALGARARSDHVRCCSADRHEGKNLAQSLPKYARAIDYFVQRHSVLRTLEEDDDITRKFEEQAG